MSSLEQMLSQEFQVFENLAASWHTATGQELYLLLPTRQAINRHGENVFPALGINGLPMQDWGNLEQTCGRWSIPITVEGRTEGYLVSEVVEKEQTPLLSWVAGTLSNYLNNEHALQGMTDELISAWDQLDLVYRITQTLSEQANLREVLQSILAEVLKVSHVEAGFIALGGNSELGALTHLHEGQVEVLNWPTKVAFLHDVLSLNQVSLINTPEGLRDLSEHVPSTWQEAILAPVQTSKHKPIVLGVVHNIKRNFTAADVKLITSVSEQLGAIIDNFEMHHELIAQERVQRELEIAAEIQASLLSQVIPQIENLELDASMSPAYEVGGDFYDFTSTHEHHLTAVVGDVAGKGIPAAMFTSMARTLIRMESTQAQDPHLILSKVNQVLQQDLGQAELFITALVVTFDSKNGGLMYANAGHTPGIVYHAQSKTSRLLKATTYPIGIAKKAHKKTQYVHLSHGDTIVLYSDGISEARNATGETFGIERLQTLIHQHHQYSPSALRKRILEAVADFIKEETLSDDITLTVIRFTKNDTHRPQNEPLNIVAEIPFHYQAKVQELDAISGLITETCRNWAYLPPGSQGEDFMHLVELAVSEICTNAIEHAYAQQQGEVSGKITLTTANIQIEVYDQGRNFNPNNIPPPMSDPANPNEGGYGLHIVRQIMDIAEYSPNTPRGNCWRLVKYLPQ